MTGGWGGIRSDLYDAGIALMGFYQSELDTNPVGGNLHKVRYVHDLSFAGFFDLERLFRLKNTFLLVSMAQRTGSSLSSDIPNFFVVQQLFGGQTIRMDHLALETSFFENRLDLVAGRLNALDDFATSSYFCYSQNIGICGNPFSLESNSNLSNYPLSSWGARARYDITRDFYSMTGAYNTYEHFADNKYHGVDFSIRHNSGVAIVQEFGYRPVQRRLAGYPGFLKLGGFYDSEPRPAFAGGPRINSNWTIYGIAQQRLYRRAIDGLQQGLTGFVSLTYSPPSKNTLEYFADAGLVYRGLLPKRPDDTLGAFGILGEFSSDLRDVQRAEHDEVQTQEWVLELNYRVQLSLWFYLEPDLQYVIRPNGTRNVGNTLVLAVETGLTL
jgi:porin